MDKTHPGKIVRLILAVSLVGLLYAPGRATIRDWQTFTSFNNVTDMVTYNGDIWAATTGGLVRINPETMTHTTYANIDGLETNELYSLHVDDRYRLWVGGKGRLVDFSDPAHPDGYLFTDRDGGLVEIYDIVSVPGGDSLWLANRLGLTLFLPSEQGGYGLILDTYTRLGEIDRDTPARRVAVLGDSVWVGTNSGLAAGSRDDVRLLKAPDGWQSYFPSQLAAIAGDTVSGLAAVGDTLFVGTSQGAYRFDRIPEPSLSRLNIYADPKVYNMSRAGDSILISNGRGTAIYHNGLVSYIPTDGLPIWNSTAGTFDADGIFWSGNLAYGVFHRQDTMMIRYDAGGMPSNTCLDIVVAQGKIWGAFEQAGLAWYVNGRWEKVTEVTGNVQALAVGPLGEIWVGNWGNGAYRIGGDSVTHFYLDNSSLSGIPGAENFVVVTDICTSDNAVWFSNLMGVDGELSAVNPYNTSEWISYKLTGGINELTVTVTEGQGVVYAGSENNGIYAIGYNGTPFYKGDDYNWMFITENSGIGSNIIKRMRVDGYDTLWVGTAFGLSYQRLGEIVFTNVDMPDGFGPEVTAIEFDGQGSVYAGSGRGLAIRDIATGTFEHLTAANSGLVSDDIRNMYYQAETGAMWIATTGGISRLTTPYAAAADDIESVLAYPNPFVIRYGTETVRFNYRGKAEVRIYTVAGELVREIPITGLWDGRNQQGEEVASGIYIFALTGDNGDVGRGKLLLIRE